MAGKSEKEKEYEDRLAERLADLLVAQFKKQSTTEEPSPWITAAQAAERAQCAPRLIYSAVKSKKLRAARVGDGRSLRFRVEWIDQWLESCAPKEIDPLK